VALPLPPAASRDRGAAQLQMVNHSSKTGLVTLTKL